MREATFVKQFEKTCWVTVVSCFKLFSVHPKATSGFGEGDGMQRHRSKTSVRPAPGRLDTAFLLGSEGNVRHCRVRLSLVGGLSAAALGKDSLGTNCFLFGSEGNVGHWLHLETGPIVRPSLR